MKKVMTTLTAAVFAVALIGCAPENAGDDVEVDPSDTGEDLGAPAEGGTTEEGGTTTEEGGSSE